MPTDEKSHKNLLTNSDTGDIELQNSMTSPATHSSTALLNNDADADAPHAIRLLEMVSELVSSRSRQT